VRHREMQDATHIDGILPPAARLTYLYRRNSRSADGTSNQGRFDSPAPRHPGIPYSCRVVDRL